METTVHLQFIWRHPYVKPQEPSLPILPKRRNGSGDANPGQAAGPLKCPGVSLVPTVTTKRLKSEANSRQFPSLGVQSRRLSRESADEYLPQGSHMSQVSCHQMMIDSSANSNQAKSPGRFSLTRTLAGLLALEKFSCRGSPTEPLHLEHYNIDRQLKMGSSN